MIKDQVSLGSDDAAKESRIAGLAPSLRDVDPLTSTGKQDLPQTWNRYTYTAGDPVNQKDPSGLFFGPFETSCDPLGPTVLLDGIELLQDAFCLELEPIPVPSIPAEEPLRCSITARTAIDGREELQESNINLSSIAPKYYGPSFSKKLGRHDTPGNDKYPMGWWLYLFEIKVLFEGNAYKTGNWEFHRIYRIRGTVGVADVPGDVRVDSIFFDDPIAGATELRGNIFYAPDAPGLERLASPGGAIVRASLDFTFSFSIINHLNGDGCDGSLTLHLEVTNGVPRWTP